MRTLEELHVVQYDTVPRGHTYLHKAARRAANRGAEWYVSTAAGCGGSCTAAVARSALPSAQSNTRRLADRLQLLGTAGSRR